MIGLEEEFSAAVCNIDSGRFAALRAAGVPDRAFSQHMVGMAPVETHRGGLFDIADDGALAVLLPVGEWDGLNWILDDIVAFYPDQPDRWWLRRGAVQILGSGNIRPEAVFPLALHDTPLSWLQAGASGVCVIDWRADPDVFAGPIEAESHSLKARLERRIQAAALAKFDISVSEVSHAA
jgi:hypothetical protein